MNEEQLVSEMQKKGIKKIEVDAIEQTGKLKGQARASVVDKDDKMYLVWAARSEELITTK